MENRFIVFARMALVTTLLVGPVAGAATDQKASAFVLCKNQKTVRTIRVTSGAKETGCVITYSKSGVDEVVGESRSLESCKSVMKNIQENLEASRWNCRSVGTANVLTSSEVVTQ